MVCQFKVWQECSTTPCQVTGIGLKTPALTMQLMPWNPGYRTSRYLLSLLSRRKQRSSEAKTLPPQVLRRSWRNEWFLKTVYYGSKVWCLHLEKICNWSFVRASWRREKSIKRAKSWIKVFVVSSSSNSQGIILWFRIKKFCQGIV